MHASVQKALSLAGFGRERVIRVRVDEQGRMRADLLPSISASTIVCLGAGNVNTGAFDPAARGYENADLWAIDGHKWLNVPYDSGMAIVKEERHIRSAMSCAADYLVTGSQREPDAFTPEMSRRIRGIEIWAALFSLGRNGLAKLIERSCLHAKRFALELEKTGYTILNEVDLNQVLVRLENDELTDRVLFEIQRSGVCWCSGTSWKGSRAIRISISNWSTTDSDVDRSLEVMKKIARSHSKSLGL